VLVPVLVLVVTMYTIFVLPKYDEILRSFHLPRPAAFEWLFAIRDVAPFLMIVVAVAVVAYTGHTVGLVLAPRLTAYNPFAALTDRLAWRLPPWRATTRHRAYADAFSAVADALDAGHPLPAALDDVAELRGNRLLRRQFARWADGVRVGLPAADAARMAGFPALAVGLIGSARAGSGGGDLAGVLRFLARYHETRFNRAGELLRAVLVPLLALSFGVVVAALALAVYQPMVDLMNALSTPGGAAGRM
jgi:type IV pilus assembly protein PilC